MFFVDFTHGGHDFVYNFVPWNEVWIDDEIEPNERGFVFLHEIHERNLMAKGMKYNPAHASSSKIEYYCRLHPEKLDKCITAELKKTVHKTK